VDFLKNRFPLFSGSGFSDRRAGYAPGETEKKAEKKVRRRIDKKDREKSQRRKPDKKSRKESQRRRTETKNREEAR
jgi:hypothetical protein